MCNVNCHVKHLSEEHGLVVVTLHSVSSLHRLETALEAGSRHMPRLTPVALAGPCPLGWEIVQLKGGRTIFVKYVWHPVVLSTHVKRKGSDIQQPFKICSHEEKKTTWVDPRDSPDILRQPSGMPLITALNPSSIR